VDAPSVRKTKGLLTKFAAICSREASYQIPRAAEQQVKAMLGLAQAPRRSALQRLWASLVYDSLNDPSLWECAEPIRSIARFFFMPATILLISVSSTKKGLPAWCWLARLPTRKLR